jgi:uncharacterized protein
MKKIPLTIIQILFSQSPSGAYTLVLGETDGLRRLPIIIGNAEAQAIALELENFKAKRPLTHDLFFSVATAYEITLEEIVINKFDSGVFCSLVVCRQGDKVIEVDSRTSDAVALALRFKCPMYVAEDVMDEAGVIIDDPDISGVIDESQNEESVESFKDVGNSENDLTDMTKKELQDLLSEAIQNEEFEKASLIRDELNRRN